MSVYYAYIFGFFFFYCTNNSTHFNCTALPLVFHIIPPTVEAFVLPSDELSFSLSVEAHV